MIVVPKTGLLKRLGPGFVTGASDDDPAGIGTYIQTGAQFGYGQLWTALFTVPVMAAIQEMCGRIGRVTGKGLAAVIRETHPPAVLYGIIAAQVITNTVNIGADLSAMAQASQLLIPLPFGVLLGALTAITTALIVLVPYRLYAAYLKFLGLVLLTYVFTAFLVHADWRMVAIAAILPHVELSKGFVLTLVAVLGVTISPYEFFWQSNEEVEEMVADHEIPREGARRPKVTRDEIRLMRGDTAFGMFFSNLITFFIIIVAAATLHAHGHTSVQTANDAARILRPLAGGFASSLFAIGIVGSGLLAIPVMAGSSAYAVGGALGWSRTLSKPFWQEWRFYGVIVASCVLGIAVNLAHVPPFTLLYYAGILNGIISPPLLFIVTRIGSDRAIMGEYRNGPFSAAMGWLMCGTMSVALVALVVLSR